MKTKDEFTAQDLLDDLRALIADAEKLVSDAVTEKSEDALRALRARFEAAQERFSDLFSSAKQKVAAGAKSADEAIRSNPYQSLGIALGAGLIMGLLLGRRND